MPRVSPPAHGPSALTLRVATHVTEWASWPAVTFLVDGLAPFADSDLGWSGFAPREILGPGAPLLPVDGGRRVAVMQCSCGIAGCGVIAPRIVASADGARVSWVDFRDYVGVFVGPTASSADSSEGSRLPFPDLHFDRAQYVAEVERATRDWA